MDKQGSNAKTVLAVDQLRITGRFSAVEGNKVGCQNVSTGEGGINVAKGKSEIWMLQEEKKNVNRASLS